MPDPDVTCGAQIGDLKIVCPIGVEGRLRSEPKTPRDQHRKGIAGDDACWVVIVADSVIDCELDVITGVGADCICGIAGVGASINVGVGKCLFTNGIESLFIDVGFVDVDFVDFDWIDISINAGVGVGASIDTGVGASVGLLYISVLNLGETSPM